MFPSRLIAACCLILAAPTAVGQIRSLAELRALPLKIASSRVPVEVEGTTLYSDLTTGALIVHDGNAACYIELWQNPRPQVGDRVRLAGHSNAPGYLPHLVVPQLEILGRGDLPKPHLLAPGEIHQPQFDTGWVEVPALVTGVESGGLAYTLAVEIYGQTFKADIPLTPDAVDRAARLMQRQVRMTAVLATVYNEKRQMTGRHFFVPSFDHLVLDGPDIDPSTPRPLKIADMLVSDNSPTDLIRIEGTITQLDPKGFHLRDSSGSTLVITPSRHELQAGARVVIDGFGTISPFRPVLRAITVTKTGQSAPPPALPIDFHPKDGPNQHLELVHLKAEYLGLRTAKDEAILQCRSGNDIFEAILPLPSPQHPKLIPGDQLALTGICELITNHPLPRLEWVTGFRLQLADSSAIQILHRAPWWNTRRLLMALAATSGTAMIFGSGVFALRRRVKKQVGIITAELEKRAVATERERMARDLHDTLEQQLTGVAMQLESLAHSPHQKSPVVAERLNLASRMLRHSREEARRSVWDLRNRMLEIHGLGHTLHSLASAALVDDGPRIDAFVDTSPTGLSPGTDYQLLRMAQEALTNALKHAAASHITLTLSLAADHCLLSVKDDGIGFDPLIVNPHQAPHFGLLGLRERAEKIGATLTISTQPGEGCAVSIKVPIPNAS
ncbi:MAG: sensor histidine kinase [Verrucomicrobia bacterium]|nr:MAG: sensor histidine kinase [Verrucomicrobiota bacterium]TAE88838.1 MAG: sensor histidine kinase [Verrucomicrobiota bacterium]TAF27255.1 MAG: sensor histidine kinase [Verrucomicrobiota bacterium]TAF42454.1 MAG: sensor histidine kinase [Verrucomicrobiota bacterium]